MHYMEHIEQAARRLHRMEATLGLMAKAGPNADLASVMEVNDLMRQELGKALEALDLAGQYEAEAEPMQVPAASAPAPKASADVLRLRPSQS